MSGKVSQEMAEEVNNSIVSAIETARTAIYYGYSEIEDEWYRSFLTDLGEAMFWIGRMVSSLNDLRYPVYPGKYGPIIGNLKKIISENPMDCSDVRGWLERYGIADSDIRTVLDMLRDDPETEFSGKEFRKSENAATGNRYTDSEGKYDEGRVKKAACRLAAEKNIDVFLTLCNNPFGSRVEIILKRNESARICDVMEFKKELSKELGTPVNIGVEYDSGEFSELF